MASDQVDESGIFPPQIITKILTRLPAKSICRFKCVSKRWNSIICEPQFLSSYISATFPSWVIFDRFIRVNLEPEPEFETHLSEPPNVSTLSANPLKIGAISEEFCLDIAAPALVMNSSNGLILFSVKIKCEPFWEMNSPTNVDRVTMGDSLYVVNPVTLDWVSIPESPGSINRQGALGFIAEVGPTGVLERFMIVDYSPLIATKIGTLVCFSSEIGKWCVFPANYMLGEHIWKGTVPLEFDGHLLWVDPRVGVIVWDDPFGGERVVHLRYIELPTKSQDWVASRCFDVAGGYVQFLEVTYEGSHKLKLWRLVDFGVGEWNLVHKLSFNEIWSDPIYMAYGFGRVMPKPYMMHPHEANVALFVVGNRVFSMDVGSGMVLSCCVMKSMVKELDKLIYLERVMLPSWPTLFPPNLKATLLREQGNVLFEAQNYNEAIDCYSKSIALSPNALTYQSRTAAYLRVDRLHEAGADASEGLKIDDEVFKANVRQAMDKKQLGDLVGCYDEAVKWALSVKPDDHELKKLYVEVLTLIDKVKLSGPVSTDPTCSG